MPADDVARVGEPAVDRPDRVGVDPEHGAQLAHGGQPRPRVEAPRVHLVGELPVELGGDGDVGVARDVQAAGSRVAFVAGMSGTTGVPGAGRRRAPWVRLAPPRRALWVRFPSRRAAQALRVAPAHLAPRPGSTPASRPAVLGTFRPLT